MNTLDAARRAQRRVNGHEIKSQDRGQEVSETKLGTFTRLLIPTEDLKNGAEGFFLLFLVLAEWAASYWVQAICRFNY